MKQSMKCQVCSKLADLPLQWHLVFKNGIFTFLLLEFILADQLADLPPTNCNASWDVYYGMYLPAIVDSSSKGGNLLLFLNN